MSQDARATSSWNSYYNVKQSNKIIAQNLENIKKLNSQVQQMQSTASTIESVVNWKTEDPRMTDDFRQQFLAKTKTRRTSERASTRERVPLATTDFGDPDEEFDSSVPIYTYNPSLGGTQV